MVISDLVTSKEVDPESANSDKWCSCIDGALTKEHYLDSIRKAGFSDVEVLEEKLIWMAIILKVEDQLPVW